MILGQNDFKLVWFVLFFVLTYNTYTSLVALNCFTDLTNKNYKFKMAAKM